MIVDSIFLWGCPSFKLHLKFPLFDFAQRSPCQNKASIRLIYGDHHGSNPYSWFGLPGHTVFPVFICMFQNSWRERWGFPMQKPGRGLCFAFLVVHNQEWCQASRNIDFSRGHHRFERRTTRKCIHCILPHLDLGIIRILPSHLLHSFINQATKAGGDYRYGEPVPEDASYLFHIFETPSVNRSYLASKTKLPRQVSEVD